MKKDNSCKYFEPSTYSVCSICKVECKYTSCHGDRNKCKYKTKENENARTEKVQG